MNDDFVFVHIFINRIFASINLNFLNTLYLKQRIRLAETCCIKVIVSVVISPLVFMLRFSHTLQLQASWSSFLTNGRSVGRIKFRIRWVHGAGV